MSRFILAVFMLLTVTSQSWAAVYYVRTDGTAVNKAAATSANSASTSMSIATHNSQAYAAGDTIYISAAGGDYTEVALSVPSSGTAGNPITYKNVIGETPLLTNSTTYPVYVANKGNITWDGINATNTSAPGFGKYGWYGVGASTTGITIKNCALTGGRNGLMLSSIGTAIIQNVSAISAESSEFAAKIEIATNVAIDGLTVDYSASGISSGISLKAASLTADNLIVIGRPGGAGLQIGIVLNLLTGYTATGNNWDVSHSAYYGGVKIVHAASPTGLGLFLNNISSNYNSNYGITIEGVATYNTSPRNYLSNLDTNNNGSFGIKTVGLSHADIGPGTSNYNGLVAQANGLHISGATDLMIEHLVTNYNSEDGVGFGTQSAADAATNITVRYSESAYNGKIGVGSSGDGYTAHLGCTGLLFHNNLVHHNLNTAFAMVNDSAGSIYNNVCYFNGGAYAGLGIRGGVNISSTTGTAGWNVKNNILVGNYPVEIQTSDTVVADAFSNNVYMHIGNGVVEDNFATTSGGGMTWAQYHALYESTSKYGDPLFKSSTDYHTRGGSPCINAGVDVGLTTDFDGKPIKGLPDIGAYEYIARRQNGGNGLGFGMGLGL